MNRITTIMLSSILAAMPAAAHADVAIVGTTGGTQFGSFSNDETIGWTFDALTSMDVIALGWFAADGSIEQAHRVGIWDTAGNLLADAIVNSQSPLTGGFGYRALTTTLRLNAGSSYVIGGRDRANDRDNYVSGYSSITTNPALRFTGAARSTVNTQFTFPNVQSPGVNGRIGPNFQFTAVAAGVPEPATWAFMILGFGAIGGTMRARRKSSVRVAFTA